MNSRRPTDAQNLKVKSTIDASLGIEPVVSAFNRIDRPAWLIHRLIECGTLGQIYAGWNVGKSALA